MEENELMTMVLESTQLIKQGAGASCLEGNGENGKSMHSKYISDPLRFEIPY